MRNSKRTRNLCILAVLIAVFAFAGGTVFITNSYSANMENNEAVAKEKWDVSIDNLSNLATVDEDIQIVKNPTYDESTGMIDFAIVFKQVNTSASFSFDIVNKGNVDGVVKSIQIEGIEDYKDNVLINIDGLKVEDKVKAGQKIENVFVTVKYNKNYFNEETEIDFVDLSNVKVFIDVEKE